MTKPAAQSQEQPVLPTASDLLALARRPAQVIAHPTWSEARDKVLALVTAGPGLIAVLGPPGSGKTTLLRDLAITLGERGHAARLLDFGDSRLELKPAEILLVDEADRMSAMRLDELRRRVDVATVLAGPSAFGERLRHSPDVAIVELAALSHDDACAFLAERLAQLGLPMGYLTEAAWARLIVHSRGVPRLLVALLRHTLSVAAEEHAERVTDAHVELAVEVRNRSAGASRVEPAPTEPGPDEHNVAGVNSEHEASADAGSDHGGVAPQRRHSRAMTTLAAVCLVAVVALLVPGGTWQADDTAASKPGASPVVVGTSAPASAAMGTEQVGKVARAGAASTPSVVEAAATGQNATGLLAPSPPAPPPRAPAATESSNAVSPEVTVSAQPSAAPAGTIHDLPTGASIRVVLTYPRGDAAAAERGLELARLLRADGLGVGDPFPVASRTSKQSISCYFAQDEGAATEIGRRLGGKYGVARLVRLSRNAGLPRPGTIEIAVGPD